MAKKTPFERIRDGLKRAVEHAEGERTLTVHEVVMPDVPKPMSPAEIAALRREKIGVSQAVFAKAINSSVQTVHAWEQGRSKPAGPSLRLLELLDKNPQLLRDLLKPV